MKNNSPDKKENMKKIEDYLHLYLGCEVWYKEKLWDLVGVSKPYKTNNTTFVSVDLRPEGKGFRDISYLSESFTDLSLIKPLLRPLSDIKKEELLEYDLIAGDMVIDTIIERVYSLAKPEKFKYLLSKHFDLFGLIEEGLAIDKTTLK